VKILEAKFLSAHWTYIHATSVDDLRNEVKNLSRNLGNDKPFTHVIIQGHGFGAEWADHFLICFSNDARNCIRYSDSANEHSDIFLPLHSKMASRVRFYIDSCDVLKGSREHGAEKALWLAEAFGVNSFELFGHRNVASPSLLMFPVPSPVTSYGEALLTMSTITLATVAVHAGINVLFNLAGAVCSQKADPFTMERTVGVGKVGVLFSLLYMKLRPVLEGDDMAHQYGYLVRNENGHGSVEIVRAYDYFWHRYIR